MSEPGRSPIAGTVFLDADGCPAGCRRAAVEVARETGWRLITVASTAHEVTSSNHIQVDNSPDAADLAILSRLQPRDVVVTGDWGLAALALARSARAIGFGGTLYRDSQMDFLLEERHLKAEFRRRGGRTRGPRARQLSDDQRFARGLRRLLESGAGSDGG